MSDAYPRDPRAWQSVQELIKCSAAFNISSDGIYLIRIRFPYESTYSQRQIPILMMATLRGRLNMVRLLLQKGAYSNATWVRPKAHLSRR